MIDYIIPLIASFLSSGIWVKYFIPIFALAFVATVPKIIRNIIFIGGR